MDEDQTIHPPETLPTPESSSVSDLLTLLSAYERVLVKGIALQAQLSAQKVPNLMKLKEGYAAQLTQDLFLDPVLVQRMPTTVRDALLWVGDHAMGITNVGTRSSVFEPPDEVWRPFVVNERSEDPRSGLLGQIQSALFRRLFSNDDDIYIFPAIGKDRAYLSRGAFLSIAPHKDSDREKDPDALRRYHINAHIEQFPSTQLEAALQDMLMADRRRVLVCKGLQDLRTPAEIVKMVRDFNISRIMVLSTACRGLAGHSKAVPYPLPQLTALLQRLFDDVTRQYVSQDELQALERVHMLMHEEYAWTSGHFPATQIEVYDV